MPFEPTDRDRAPQAVERRKRRLAVPPCTSCGSANTAVATRTEYVVYIRCADCRFVWSLPKAVQGPFES